MSQTAEVKQQQQENQNLQKNQVTQSQALSENENPNPSQNQSVKNEEPFRIGIIVNGYNYEDIKYYNEQFKTINNVYKRKADGFNKVVLVFFGYRPEDDKLNALDGVNYEYVKPVSIVHYFKQLKALNLNLLFIPLIPNTYNNTSENYNKFLEASLCSIPTIAPDVYPYNSIIKDKRNGFMFGKRENFITYLIDLLEKNFGLINVCSSNAYKEVTESFNYSKKNMEIFSSFFNFDDEQVSDNDEFEPQNEE